MMKIEIEPAVLAKLEEIAEQNQHLSSDEREKLSEKIGRDTPELGVKMRELFADKKIYQSAQLAAAPLSKPQPEKADGGWGKRRSLREVEEDRLEQPAAAKADAKAEEAPRETVPEIDEPEREVEPAPEAMFRQEQAKPDDDVPILSKAAPFDSAREFARRHCFQQGFLATYFWREDFWQWNGCHYERMPATRINDQVYAFLDRARTGREDETVRFRPKPQDAEAVIKCLKAGLGLEGAPPRWLDADEGPKAENLLVFRNWLVDVTTGKTYPLTPKLWVQDAVDFAYDPQARCPRWEKFLREIFPDDQVSQDCIEEQLGYGTTNETRFEKGALWIGVRRSGKSTVAYIHHYIE